MLNIYQEQQNYLHDRWHEEFIEAKFINSNDLEDNNFQIWIYNGWGYDNSIPHCQVMTNKRETILFINLIDLTITKTIGDKNNEEILYGKFINWLNNIHSVFKEMTNEYFLLYMFDGGTLYGSEIVDYLKENNIHEIRVGLKEYVTKFKWISIQMKILEKLSLKKEKYFQMKR